MGAYYQMNTGSLQGAAGWSVKRFSKKMLDYGMITFLATDTHDMEKRPPAFGKAADWILKKRGEEEASRYFTVNPEMILQNKAI